MFLCWKLNDMLIHFNLIDINLRSDFICLLHNQSNMYDMFVYLFKT